MTERAEIVLSMQDRTRAAIESAKRNLNELKATAVGVAGAFGPVGRAVALLGVPLSLVSFKGIVSGIDALNDLKDATGSSIENLSALEDIGARTGTTFDTVGTALVKFNNLLREAKPASDTAELLKRIGLNAEELKRQDPSEALRNTAIALTRFADDGNKARIIAALFGKSVREVAPFLKDLAEAGGLNAKVTTQQSEEAERFNKELSRLEKNSKDAARSLTSSLIPALNNLLEKSREQGFFALFGFDKEFKAKRELAAAAVEVNDLHKRATILKNGLEIGFYGPQFQKELDDTNAKLALAKRRFNELDPKNRKFDPAAGAGRGFTNPEFVKPSAPDVPDTAGARKAADEALANLRKVIDGNVKAVAAALETTRDELRFDEEFSRQFYDRGLQSLEAFYVDQDKARKDNLAAMRRATEVEIAERQKLLNSPLLKGDDKKAERQDVVNQVAEARAKLRAAERESDQAAKLSVLDRQRAVEALRDNVSALAAQIRDLSTGQTANADLLSIAERVREAGRVFSRGGASDQEAATRATEYGRLLEVQRQFTEARENFTRVTDDAERAEEMLLITSQRQGVGLIESETKVRDLRSVAVQQLDTLVAKSRELLALNPQNSDLMRGLQQLELQAEKAREAMDPTKLRLDAAADDIGDALAESIGRAATEGGKLRDILGDIGRQIQQIVTRELITKPIAQDISGFIKGSGGKGLGENLLGVLMGKRGGAPAASIDTSVAGTVNAPTEERDALRAMEAAAYDGTTALAGLETGAANGTDALAKLASSTGLVSTVLGALPGAAATPLVASFGVLATTANSAAAALASVGSSQAGGGLLSLLGSSNAFDGASSAGFGSGAGFGNFDLGLSLDRGGYTGDKGVKEAAGVVHGKEFVFSAPATKNIGRGVLEKLHRAGKRGARAMLPGYEQGGFVGMASFASVQTSAPRPKSRASAAEPSSRRDTPIVVNVQAVPGMSRKTALQQGRDIADGLTFARLRNG